MSSVTKFTLIQIYLKTVADYVLAIIGFILLSPLFLIIAIAIKLNDGGPVFFTQPRLGLGGRIFKICKFRTMVVNADRFLNSNGESTINRITRVGNFLRKTSLDELPQLFNILLGHMSFIGPRPTLVEHWDRYTDLQRGRSAMRPGVSGLAQVMGRSFIPWSKRIEYDLQYIKQYSLFLDLKIVMLTIKIVLLRKSISMDRNTTFADDLGPPRSKKE